MRLDDIYMPAIRIDGTRIRRVEGLGEWPKKVVLTPAQREVRRLGGLSKLGVAKAANGQGTKR